MVVQMDRLINGQEYIRQAVLVHPLDEPIPLQSFVGEDKDLIERIIPTQPGPIDDIKEKDCVEAETYVFDQAQASTLEPELWSFTEFMQENAWKWYGGRAPRSQEMPETEVS